MNCSICKKEIKGNDKQLFGHLTISATKETISVRVCESCLSELKN